MGERECSCWELPDALGGAAHSLPELELSSLSGGLGEQPVCGITEEGVSFEGSLCPTEEGAQTELTRGPE